MNIKVKSDTDKAFEAGAIAGKKYSDPVTTQSNETWIDSTGKVTFVVDLSREELVKAVLFLKSIIADEQAQLKEWQSTSIENTSIFRAMEKRFNKQGK